MTRYVRADSGPGPDEEADVAEGAYPPLANIDPSAFTAAQLHLMRILQDLRAARLQEELDLLELEARFRFNLYL